MPLTDEQETLLGQMLDEIGAVRKSLNDWERGFFDDQVKRYEEFKSKMTLTPKQWAVLHKMHEKATDAA